MPARRFYLLAPRFHSMGARVKVLSGHFRDLAGVRSTGAWCDRRMSEGLYSSWNRPRAPRASRPLLRNGHAALPTPGRTSTGRRIRCAPPARHVRCLRNGRAGLPTPRGSRPRKPNGALPAVRIRRVHDSAPKLR